MPDTSPVTKAELEASLMSFEERVTKLLEERLAGMSKELREYIDERTHDAETRLLRAFSDYQHAETRASLI